jgi:hypothetical protein
MIQFTCPNCRSKLKAKPTLAGHVRKCPKCGEGVRIVADAAPAADLPDMEGAIPLDETESDQHVLPATEDHLRTFRAPERLNRASHYLICDKTHVVATWENNGNGWMIKSGASFIPAKRNRDRLPTQGEFQLVELKFAMTPEGKRLTGIGSFRLATHWALTTLDQGDDLILEKVTGLGCLNRDQKATVRLTFREQFMRPVWEGATAVLEYLGNADYHSPGVG